jgi:hypothetical protein
LSPIDIADLERKKAQFDWGLLRADGYQRSIFIAVRHNHSNLNPIAG